MIVDSSAVVALLNDEPDAEVLLTAIRAAGAPQMSVANFLECALVVDGYGRAELSEDLEPLLDRLRITLAPVTVEQAHVARAAHRR